MPRGDEVVPIVNRLAENFRSVVLTQDWHPAGHLSFASTHPGQHDCSALRTASAVARPLRAGHPRRCFSRCTANSPCWAGAAQGTPPDHRFVLGVLRERSRDTDRPCGLSSRARHQARIPGRPGARFLRPVFGRRRGSRGLRGRSHRRCLPRDRRCGLGTGDLVELHCTGRGHNCVRRDCRCRRGTMTICGMLLPGVLLRCGTPSLSAVSARTIPRRVATNMQG